MHTINKLSNTDWAWLAGFIDGDGCIGIYKDSDGYMAPRVTVAQKDREVLDKIVAMLGTGSVTAAKTQTGVQHHLGFGSAVSRQICEGILPYLMIDAKRQNCEAVIALEKKIRIDSAKHRAEADKAEALYLKGVTIQEIATRLKAKPATVGYWLRQRGVTRSLSEAQAMRRKRERTKHK